MSKLAMFVGFRDRRVAAILALVGIIAITGKSFPSVSWQLSGWHLVGLHKFYLGQSRWGLIYLLLSWTPIPVIAAIAESIWYLAQDSTQFNAHFNQSDPTGYFTGQHSSSAIAPLQIDAIADAIHQLDQLREDGLVSEYEFELKRRQLLDRMG
jgi:TM2 domain-containing membrane protein YozV